MSQLALRIADPAGKHSLAAAGTRPPAVPIAEGAWRIAGCNVEVVMTLLDAEAPAAGELAQCLSADERLRAGRFVFERDRRRYIVGRARLRHLLGARLGVRPEALEFAYGPRGKPRLAQDPAGTDLRFNMSHCEGVAVCAFAHGREVGVDVEAVRALDDADEVAARFFSPRENEAYLALAPQDRPRGFFNCWTRKEAFIKAMGDGLHFPLDAFDVSLAPGEPAQILRIGETAGTLCGWTLRDVDLPLMPHFVAAVVVHDGIARA